MNAESKLYYQLVEDLDITGVQKQALLSEFQNFEEQVLRADFRLSRTMKDKAIMVNLLNKTIGDLQAYQGQLEDANKNLTEKNKEIAFQNLKLLNQKEQLEAQSVTMAENLRKLELSYAELEQFSFIASHDLKSPLRAISSYAQLLRHRYGGNLAQEADEYINYIVSGVSHMDMILSDLLEYARVGKENILRNSDLRTLFDVAHMHSTAKEGGKTLDIKCGELPNLMVVETGVIILFQHLLSNSIKFNTNSTINIQFSAEEKDDVWEFCFEDNGIGLDKRYENKVYKPFQRLLPKEYEGTGMGLAFCKKVIQLHHGKIWYDVSKHLGGTAFYFTISKNLY